MKLFIFLALAIAFSSAPVVSERRRQRPPGNRPPPPPDGPPPPRDNGTLNGTSLPRQNGTFDETRPRGNGTFNGTLLLGNGTLPRRNDSAPLGNDTNPGSQGTGIVPDNIDGLETLNITSNGTEYYNVRYINATTMKRIAIDNGVFTIPAGCYPCVGAHWCANIVQPPTCRGNPACDFTDQVDGCEDMLPSPAEKISTCEECHANGSDYCIAKNICVEVASASCQNKKDHITSDIDYANLGHSMNCDDADPGYNANDANKITLEPGSSKSKDLNLTLILACGVPLVLFLCVCGIARHMRKDPASSFDAEMFDKYDETVEIKQDGVVELQGTAGVTPDDSTYVAGVTPDDSTYV